MWKMIILSLILVVKAQATEIKVSYNNFKSIIVSTVDLVSYKDVNTFLSLKIKKCNEHILKRLSKELSEKSRNLLLEKVEGHPMTISIDSQENIIDERSKRGQFFHHYIDVIKQAKIEEKLNCDN